MMGKKKKEGNDMEAAANLQAKRAKLWNLANKNTVKNKDGLTVLTKDSPYRNEKGWESDIKDSKDDHS